MTDAPLMLEPALRLAAFGWPVFPCNWRQGGKAKAPLVAGADKGPGGKPVPKTGGLYRATTDQVQIREWWHRWPLALIGVPMGRPSGVFAIDLDPKGETAADTLARLIEAVGALPPGPVSQTQSGGRHLFFALPRDEAELPRNSAKRLDNIDWRGDGGYVVVPPSMLSDGKAYRWLVAPATVQDRGPDVETLPFPAAPARLLDLVYQRGDFARGRTSAPEPRPGSGARSFADRTDPVERDVRRYAQAALDNARMEVARASRGTRGHTLNAVAFSLAPFVALGVMSAREVSAALQDGADACGLTETDGPVERDAKIARGLKAGAASDGVATLERKLAEIRTDSAARVARFSGRAASPAAPIDHPSAGSSLASDEGGGNDGGKGGGGFGDGAGGEGEGPPVDPELLARLAGEPQNDTGNARRLIAHFGSDMLNVRIANDSGQNAALGAHWWAGTHWEPTGGGHAFERWAQSCAELVALEAPYLDLSDADRELVESAAPLKGKRKEDLTEDERDLRNAANAAMDRLGKRRADRRKFAVSCGNRSRTLAMIHQALPHITVEPEALDAEPLAINVANGTLRLVRREVEDLECPDPDVVRMKRVWAVELHPHAREDLIAKCMPVEYRPDAESARWRGFMDRFQPSEAMQRFLQRFYGYCLTGLMGEQVMVYHYGGGSNGKSTFMEALARLQGQYAQLLPKEALVGDQERRGDQATPEYARLPGTRMVRVPELKRGEKLREAAVKQMTGGEPMLVRPLHGRFFEMRPSFKLVGSGNDKPLITGVDHGIWRRMRLVVWKVTISDAEARPFERVVRELVEEGPGILNWLLEGLVDYLTHGLRAPEEVIAATTEYRHQMDPVGEFLEAHVERVDPPADEDAPRRTVTAKAMYDAYVGWCEQNSEKAFSHKAFASIMQQKGMDKKMGRIREYLDCVLVDPPPHPDKPGGWL